MNNFVTCSHISCGWTNGSSGSNLQPSYAARGLTSGSSSENNPSFLSTVYWKIWHTEQYMHYIYMFSFRSKNHTQ